MAGIGGVVLQFSADTRKAARDIDKLTRAIKGVGDQSKKSGDLMGGLGKAAKFGVAGIAAGAAVGATAIAGLLTKSVNLAANFEESQNVLQSALGATAEDMKKLSDLAKQLGSSTVFSAQDSSDAMIELAKAGQTTAEIMGGSVAAAMALAATEGIALDRAAVILSQTMSQFGIKSKRAGKIVDILAAGATASTASVDDLAGGLSYVGASAKGLKIPLKTTVTALAALNNKGLDATTAGTGLNQMLLRIASPTNTAAQVMEDYGLSLVDAKGEMKPMTEVIGILNDKLGNLSSTERADVLKRIFQVQGGRAAGLLLQTGVKGFEDLAKAVDETGRAQEMADARTKGFKGALEKLSGAAETIGIKIGEKLLPTLTGWIDAFTDWVDTPAGTVFFDTLATKVEDTVLAVKDWVEDTFVPAMQKVYDWFASPEGQQAIKDWGDAIQSTADAIEALAAAFDKVSGAFDRLPKFLRTNILEFLDLKNGEYSPFNPYGSFPGAGIFEQKMPKEQVDGLTGSRSDKPANRATVNVYIENGKQEKSIDSAAMAIRIAKQTGGR